MRITEILILFITELILYFRKNETEEAKIISPRIEIPINFKNSMGLTKSLNSNSNLSVQIANIIVSNTKLTVTTIKYFKDFLNTQYGFKRLL